MDRDLPDDALFHISTRMYFDGASNRKGYGAGVVLVAPDGEHIPISSPSTNNVAEYEACLLGLNALAELGVRAVEVYGDSFLVIAQTQGKWKTKDETLLMYQALLDRTIACFDELTFSYIPRNQNHFADALATLASYVDMPDQTKIMPIIVQQKFEPIIGAIAQGLWTLTLGMRHGTPTFATSLRKASIL